MNTFIPNPDEQADDLAEAKAELRAIRGGRTTVPTTLTLHIVKQPSGRFIVRAYDHGAEAMFTMTYRTRRAAASAAFARITKGWRQ